MTKLVTALQINNCEMHPLILNALISYQKEDDGWTWEVERVNHIELVIGDKIGIDVTDKIMADKTAKAIVIAAAADCEDQILEAIAGAGSRKEIDMVDYGNSLLGNLFNGRAAV